MGVKRQPPTQKHINMNLSSLDPALGCSGLMSIFSYDSHTVSRGARHEHDGHRDHVHELRCHRDTPDRSDNSYTKEEMDLEIARVSREMYKAFSGLNEGFQDAKDQIVIDELSTHTDDSRKELIHPYKTLYGRSLNFVLKDNLGDNWEEACSILMSEVRMYELECLRRRIEDKAAAALAKEQNEEEEEIEELDVEEAMRDVEKMQKLKICSHTRNVANGNGHVVLEDIVEDLD